MSESVDLDALFAIPPVIDTGVDALLAEFAPTPESNDEMTAKPKPKEALLSKRKQRAPNWYIPLPKQNFRFISKANISNVMREKMNLIIRHATLSDNFYFDHWVAKSRNSRSQNNKISHRLASIVKPKFPNLGLDDIQEHLEQRLEEEEAKLQEEAEKMEKKEKGENVEDEEEEKGETEGEVTIKKIRLLGRFVHNSLRHGRGVTTWGKQKDGQQLEDVPDILPPNVPPKQVGSFDRDSNAVSRRFVEQGFEILIRAQDDLIMIESLPPLPLIPPTDLNTEYKLRVDTQDVQFSEVVSLTRELNGGTIQPSEEDPYLAQNQQQQMAFSHTNSYQPQSAIQTETITYPQLLTLHTKLRESLNRVMDELFELLDIQYTIQHVFGTLDNFARSTLDIPLEVLTLAPIRDIALQYQLPPHTPLSQLPFILPHLPWDVMSIVNILDNGRYTSFTGFDTYFLKLMLPLPRTRLLFSKAIQVAHQGNLPHLNRLLGFVLELLPRFMQLDENALTSHLATVPVTQLEYVLPPDNSTPKAVGDEVGPEDEKKDEKKKSIVIPYCLFSSTYLQYSRPVNAKPVTIKVTAANPNQQLAQAVAAGLQAAQPHIIQRCADQVHQFFVYHLEFPFQHSFPYTQLNMEGAPGLPGPDGQAKYDDSKFHPYLEQLGIFFGLLRDGLFGPIFKAFLVTMENIQSKIPLLEQDQMKLLSEISQLSRYKDLFLCYGRAVQTYIRSLVGVTDLETFNKSKLPLPPTTELLNKVLQDMNVPITPDILTCVELKSDKGFSALSLGGQTDYEQLTPQELSARIQLKLSETVRIVFEEFQMKQHKESLELKQAEERTLSREIGLYQSSQARITERIVLSALVPLSAVFLPSQPAPEPSGSESLPPPQSPPRPPLGLPESLLQDNLIWWLFLGIKTSDELIVGLNGQINHRKLFNTKYEFKSGGPESLWNVFFNTDPHALQTIANRVKQRRQRFKPQQRQAMAQYNRLPLQYLNVKHSMVGRKKQNDLSNRISQKTKGLCEAALLRYRGAIEKATQFNTHEIEGIEDQVNLIRNDFYAPHIHLPQAMQLFIQKLKDTQSVTKTLYQRVEFTTNVETIVSILTLLAIFLPPGDFNLPCMATVGPVLSVWLHVQKSTYIDYAKLIGETPEPIMPWFNFLSTLPYAHHFQQLLPPSDFQRVHHQVDTVCGMYSFLAGQNGKYQNFQRGQYSSFLNELTAITAQGEQELKRGAFPQLNTGPNNGQTGQFSQKNGGNQQQQQTRMPQGAWAQTQAQSPPLSPPTDDSQPPQQPQQQREQRGYNNPRGGRGGVQNNREQRENQQERQPRQQRENQQGEQRDYQQPREPRNNQRGGRGGQQQQQQERPPRQPRQDKKEEKENEVEVPNTEVSQQPQQRGYNPNTNKRNFNQLKPTSSIDTPAVSTQPVAEKKTE